MLKDIESLEAEITDRIASHPALARRSQILLSIPGIGPVSAALLVACLPELGTASENGGDKLVHGSGGISQPRAE